MTQEDRKVTEAQRAARSKNAKEHSTGPRTVEGKRASSRNATKHGVWSRELHLITNGPIRDDIEEVVQLATEIDEELVPTTRLERELADDVVHQLVSKRRIRTLKQDVLSRVEVSPLDDPESLPPAPVMKIISQANWCSRLAEVAERTADVVESPSETRGGADLELVAGRLFTMLPDDAVIRGWEEGVTPSSVEEWRTVINRIVRALARPRRDLVAHLRAEAADLRAQAEPGLALAGVHAARRVLSSGVLDNFGRLESHVRSELQQALSTLKMLRTPDEE